MVLIYIALLVWFAVFLISSYSFIVNGSNWGGWMTGICLWIGFAGLMGAKLFN